MTWLAIGLVGAVGLSMAFVAWRAPRRGTRLARNSRRPRSTGFVDDMNKRRYAD